MFHLLLHPQLLALPVHIIWHIFSNSLTDSEWRFWLALVVFFFSVVYSNQRQMPTPLSKIKVGKLVAAYGWLEQAVALTSQIPLGRVNQCCFTHLRSILVGFVWCEFESCLFLVVLFLVSVERTSRHVARARKSIQARQNNTKSQRVCRLLQTRIFCLWVDSSSCTGPN